MAGLLLMLSVGMVSVLLPLSNAGAETGFTNHNPDDPISFTADRLEVKKEGRVAAFIGNVDAVQGDMHLSADVVKVYYKRPETDDEDDADLDDEGADNEDATGLAGFGGSVGRIDTSGNVTIESRGDTATGDWAVYDIARKIVTIGGNVVLTRQETVLTGSRLELDLENGRSTIQSSQSSQGDSRVRGEFTPTNNAED
jgi:lipopolysaccharide export system protein LptA